MLLQDAASHLGPLTPDRRQAILAFLDDPTPDAWRAIRSTIVNPRSMRLATLWQNVVALDPRYRTPAACPDALLVARAIHRGTS